jgi:hypothetical protein
MTPILGVEAEGAIAHSWLPTVPGQLMRMSSSEAVVEVVEGETAAGLAAGDGRAYRADRVCADRLEPALLLSSPEHQDCFAAGRDGIIMGYMDMVGVVCSCRNVTRWDRLHTDPNRAASKRPRKGLGIVNHYINAF